MSKLKGVLAALTFAAALTAGVISNAAGEPTAVSAKKKPANTMIANATPTFPTHPGGDFFVQINGQIQALSHKLGPRRCRVGRAIHAAPARLDVGPDSWDTTSHAGGHFDFTITLQYGGTDSTGRFYNGNVDFSGGKVTIPLTVMKDHVGKDKLGFTTFICRPLGITLQFDAPPEPGPH